MTKNRNNEKGQALVIIALGMIAFFSIIALAVDGNSIYSDRRHAQNAADTAVLAAARAYVRADESWETAAKFRAAQNDYDNNETTNWVVPELLPISNDGSQLIQVTITSHIDLDFAQFIGMTEHTNVVFAKARVKPGVSTPLFPGHAGVGLSQDCGGSNPIITIAGNSSTTMVGGGLMANTGSCNTNAVKADAGAIDFAGPSICTAGGAMPDIVGNSDFATTTSTGCEQIDPTTMSRPNIVCSGNAVPNGNTLSPGNWNGDFPPNGIENLDPGTYCISGGDLRMSNNDVLFGEKVLIYLVDGGVQITGGNLHLTAPDSGPYEGLVLYAATDADITINGNADDLFWDGTLLAPYSEVQLTGGSGSEFNGQIVSDTLDLNGGNGLTINYVPEDTWSPPVLPILELVE